MTVPLTGSQDLSERIRILLTHYQMTKNLDLPKLKTFEDYKINMVQIMDFVSER